MRQTKDATISQYPKQLQRLIQFLSAQQTKFITNIIDRKEKLK